MARIGRKTRGGVGLLIRYTEELISFPLPPPPPPPTPSQQVTKAATEAVWAGTDAVYNNCSGG